MKKFGIVLYMLMSVGIGIWTFFACMLFTFNIGVGFLSSDNKPFAISIAAITLLAIAVFLIAGKMILKNNLIVVLSFIMIVVTAFLTLPLYTFYLDAINKY